MLKPTAALLSAAALASLATPAHAIDVPALRYVDRYTLPYSPSLNGTTFGNTLFGGISGLDRDAAGNYYALSDDRSQFAPGGGNPAARFYSISIAVGAAGFVGPTPVTINSTETLKRPNATTFPALSVDPESIRLRSSPAGASLYWTSEGAVSTAGVPNIQPTVVREMSLSGVFIREFTSPAKMNADGVGAAQTRGVRNNLGYESLTFSPDGTRTYAAAESSLFQDGPRATATTGSTNRIVEFDTATANVLRELVYVTDPIQSLNPANASDNGLVELLSIGGSQFLAVERSFALNEGTNIRIYKIDLAAATDVSAFDSLVGQTYTAVSKQLLLTLAQPALGGTFNADNIEAITLGPVLPNGDQSFILTADNNFSAAQSNLFILIAVPEPTSVLALLPALPLLARRRKLA